MPIGLEALGAARRLVCARLEAPKVGEQAVKKAFDRDSLALGEAIADGELFTGRPGTKTYMETLLHETGGDGLPQVVSADEIAQAVGRGERELYRGVSKPEYAAQFKQGPLVVGSKNANGAGIWVAFGPKAKAAASGYARGPQGLIHMTLKPEAKTIDYATITARQKADRAEATKAAVAERQRLQALIQAAPTDAERQALQKQASEAARLASIQNGFRFADLGRYAALLGYDAVEMPSTGYMLVVNRTMLRVEG